MSARGSGQARLGGEQPPPLPRPELLDVVDRLDVEDHPNLLEPVGRMERDADPPKCRLDRWSCGRRRSRRLGQTRSPQTPCLLLDDRLDRCEELLRTHTDTAAEC